MAHIHRYNNKKEHVTRTTNAPKIIKYSCQHLILLELYPLKTSLYTKHDQLKKNIVESKQKQIGKATLACHVLSFTHTVITTLIYTSRIRKLYVRHEIGLKIYLTNFYNLMDIVGPKYYLTGWVWSFWFKVWCPFN